MLNFPLTQDNLAICKQNDIYEQFTGRNKKKVVKIKGQIRFMPPINHLLSNTTTATRLVISSPLQVFSSSILLHHYHSLVSITLLDCLSDLVSLVF